MMIGVIREVEKYLLLDRWITSKIEMLEIWR